MRRVVLVTRPEPGLSETAQAVERQGWRAVACPVLQITFSAPIDDLSCEAVAITSTQALPFLAHQDRERLLLTVGSATAQRARDVGFRHVEPAAGTQIELEALCRAKGLGGAGLVFACGRGRKGQAYGADIAHALQARRVEAYRVGACEALPMDALEALSDAQVAAALFYSSETVRVFMECLTQEQRSALKQCRAICLSKAIAETAASYEAWGAVEIGPPLSLLGKI